MKTKNFLLLIILLVANIVFASDWLYVRDPRGWKGGNGTIEEAIISVNPRGLFTECGLYLTFSAKGLNFSSSDTLEVEFQFDLPNEAIVHDSWLWIGDSIIQAEIMDKWTASQIYEDIVKRRRDPSIMFNKGNGHYELRIFPMAGNEKRKVKITYLMPAQWTSNSVLTSLPTGMLRTSKYQLSKFYVLTWLRSEWKNPSIIEFPSLGFDEELDPKYGKYYRVDLPPEAIQSYLNYVIDAPFKDGIYLNHFSNNESNIYQLAFLPSKALNLNISQKVAILFDYDASKSNLSTSDVLNNSKSHLHSYFTSSDSFNLIFSKLNIQRVSENWLPADSVTIESTFNNLGTDPIASYSNLPSLLANGIDFVKEKGNNGSILLISNTEQVGDSQVANQLIKDLLALMNPKLPIHVGDFQNQNYTWHNIGGRSYRGNEYFYSNLSRLTQGNYLNIRSINSFSDMLSSILQSLGGFIGTFDLHTTLANGFCFGRYTYNLSGQSTYLNKPILQIGKYNGDFPFVAEVSGLYQNESFSQEYEIPQIDAVETDSLSEEIWAGNYIQSLQSEPQTNDIVNEIINYSIDQRILSIYTSFICLEPQLGGKILSNPWDESELVSFVNPEQVNSETDSLFQAYPNPFNTETVIKIKLRKTINIKNISFNIYNILGRVVKTYKPILNSTQNELDFIWDGKDNNGQDLATGNYFFVISGSSLKKTLKLLLLK